MSPTEPKKPKPTRWGDIILGVLLFLFVVGAWFGYKYWILSAKMPPEGMPLDGMTQRGLFGDMFGGLNTLFSGLAFAGIIFTVYLQMKELALQREELESTREELKRSANANTQAANALSKQIENQLLAARISGVSALLASVNAALSGESNFIPRGVSPPLYRLELLKQRELTTKDLNDLLTGAGKRDEPDRYGSIG